jgi:predicted ferric reductase
MTKRLPPLRLIFNEDHACVRHIGTLVHITSTAACSAIVALSAWAYFQQQLSVLSLSCIVLLAAVLVAASYADARAMAQCTGIEHTGHQSMLLLHESATLTELTDATRLEANWLAFHRLGRVAWLSLSRTENSCRSHTFFLWQTARNTAHSGSTLKDWARRWHTLQSMIEKTESTEPSGSLKG